MGRNKLIDSKFNDMNATRKSRGDNQQRRVKLKVALRTVQKGRVGWDSAQHLLNLIHHHQLHTAAFSNHQIDNRHSYTWPAPSKPPASPPEVCIYNSWSCHRSSPLLSKGKAPRKQLASKSAARKTATVRSPPLS